MICPTCRSTLFEEDDQGALVCQLCGTQSQEYIAESFDAEEGMIHATQGGRLRTIRKPTGLSQQKQALRLQAIAENENDAGEAGDLLPFLTAIQCSLKIFLDAIIHSANSSVSFTEASKQSLEAVVKRLWMSYLDYLDQCIVNYDIHLPDLFTRLGASTGIMVANPPLSNADNPRPGQSLPPLLPSKPLLIGLLYLAIRLERLPILPCDLSRMIQCNTIPYAGLWLALPPAIRTSMTMRHRFWFSNNYQLPSSPDCTLLVAPTNVWFHTTMLAEALCVVPLPPLHTTMIARRMIVKLGLPLEAVWSRFVDLTHLHTSAEGSAATPIKGLDVMSYYDHPQDIMAMVLVAVKFTLDWPSWQYHRDLFTTGHTSSTEQQDRQRRHHNDTHKQFNTHRQTSLYDASLHGSFGIAFPSTLADLDRVVPRVLLKPLLTDIANTIPSINLDLPTFATSSYGHTFQYNLHIHKLLEAIPLDDLFDRPMLVAANNLIDWCHHGQCGNVLGRLPNAPETGPQSLQSIKSVVALNRALYLNQKEVPPQTPKWSVQSPIYTRSGHYTYDLYTNPLEWVSRSLYLDNRIHKMGCRSTDMPNAPCDLSSWAAHADQVGPSEFSGLDDDKRVESDKYDSNDDSDDNSDGNSDKNNNNHASSSDIMQNKTSSRIRAGYLTYARHAGDPQSALHPQFVALVERCAAYLYVGFGSLFALVEDIDLQIVNLAQRRPLNEQRIVPGETASRRLDGQSFDHFYRRYLRLLHECTDLHSRPADAAPVAPEDQKAAKKFTSKKKRKKIAKSNPWKVSVRKNPNVAKVHLHKRKGFQSQLAQLRYDCHVWLSILNDPRLRDDLEVYRDDSERPQELQAGDFEAYGFDFERKKVSAFVQHLNSLTVFNNLSLEQIKQEGGEVEDEGTAELGQTGYEEIVVSDGEEEYEDEEDISDDDEDDYEEDEDNHEDGGYGDASNHDPGFNYDESGYLHPRPVTRHPSSNIQLPSVTVGMEPINPEIVKASTKPSKRKSSIQVTSVVDATTEVPDNCEESEKKRRGRPLGSKSKRQHVDVYVSATDQYVVEYDPEKWPVVI